MSAPIQKTVTRDAYIATRTAKLRDTRDRLAAKLADPSGITGAAHHEARSHLNGIDETIELATEAAGAEWDRAGRREPRRRMSEATDSALNRIADSRARWSKPYATCSCGKSFTATEWCLLPLVGVQRMPGESLELRNCSCGSTISVAA